MKIVFKPVKVQTGGQTIPCIQNGGNLIQGIDYIYDSRAEKLTGYSAKQPRDQKEQEGRTTQVRETKRRQRSWILWPGYLMEMGLTVGLSEAGRPQRLSHYCRCGLRQKHSGFSCLYPGCQALPSIGWTQLEAEVTQEPGKQLEGSLPIPTVQSRAGRMRNVSQGKQAQSWHIKDLRGQVQI